MKSPLAIAGPKFVSKEIPIIPVWPGGKAPCIHNGLRGASCDPNTVNGWLLAYPKANVGVLTGSKSGLLVLDVDMGKDRDGEHELRDLQQTHGPLPKTVEAKTPRGGRHLYFRMPQVPIRSRAGVLSPSIDVRADGGYVLSPPSVVGGGCYAYVGRKPGVNLAACPEWLVELLKDKPIVPTKRRTPKPLDRGTEAAKIHDALGAIRGPGYDDWIRVGMALHSHEPGGDGLELFRHWTSVCSPVRSNPVTDQEVNKKWRSFGKNQSSVQIATLYYLAGLNGWKIKDEHKSDTFRSSRHIR